jgi:hypothetical protein
MMPEQLPNIKEDIGTQTDARNYAKSVAPRVKALDVENALYLAYLQGCANGFRTGWRIAEHRAQRGRATSESTPGGGF